MLFASAYCVFQIHDLSAKANTRSNVAPSGCLLNTRSYDDNDTTRHLLKIVSISSATIKYKELLNLKYIMYRWNLHNTCAFPVRRWFYRRWLPQRMKAVSVAVSTHCASVQLRSTANLAYILSVHNRIGLLCNLCLSNIAAYRWLLSISCAPRVLCGATRKQALCHSPTSCVICVMGQ